MTAILGWVVGFASHLHMVRGDGAPDDCAVRWAYGDLVGDVVAAADCHGDQKHRQHNAQG